MANISQLLSVSFPLIVAEKKKAANQWAESSFLTELEKQGGIVRKALGSTIDAPLDYQRNQGAVFQTTDLQALSMTKTEVVTSATYEIAELTAPMVWSKKDEATNESETQKIALTAQIANNGLNTHDDFLEQYLFATSTFGFLGLLTHIADAGTGTDGTIDSSTSTWWRNQQATYIDDTDIEATFTTVWNACAKGSGSKLQPTIMVSDGATQALFEGTQQTNQRWAAGDNLNAGFKVLKFKNANYVFSKNGGTRVFFLNPKVFQLIVSKSHYKLQGDVQEIPNANGYISKIYSALQTIVTNRSRLGSAHL